MRILPDLTKQIPHRVYAAVAASNDDAATASCAALEMSAEAFDRSKTAFEAANFMKFGLDPIIQLKHAAALLGCHPDTIRNREREGKIKLMRLGARRIGVQASELKRFTAACAAERSPLKPKKKLAA